MCMYVYICICVYTYIYIYICKVNTCNTQYICIHIYIYIYTYMMSVLLGVGLAELLVAEGLQGGVGLGLRLELLDHVPDEVLHLC